MEQKNIYLIVVAVIICVVIACLSPFIASGDPDGLEKSAEDANAGGIPSLSEIYSSPFPDYTFEPLDKLGEVGVLIIGTIITLALCYGIALVVRKN